jgi:hypothetical protein
MPAHGAQQGILADRQHQPLRQRGRWPTAQSDAEMMDDRLEPGCAPSKSAGDPLTQRLGKNAVPAAWFSAAEAANRDAHLNGVTQLAHWLGTVANPRVHATTQRVVNEAFAEEKLVLRPLPLVPFRAVLKLERRVSHEGMVSVGGNLYSVPDATRKRVVEVHMSAAE